MQLERGPVPPARVDVELVRVAHRLERAVAQATGLGAARALHLPHRLADLVAHAGARVQPREHEYLHGGRRTPEPRGGNCRGGPASRAPAPTLRTLGRHPGSSGHTPPRPSKPRNRYVCDHVKYENSKSHDIRLLTNIRQV